MKTIKHRSSQLWEQWLQRLHGIEDPHKDYYRLELLQLLVRSSGNNIDRFCNRFGTILCHSLHCGSVIILDKKNERIIYQDPSIKDKSLEKKISSRLPVISQGISIRQFPRGIKVFSNLPAVKSICTLQMRFFGDEEIFLIITSIESLPSEDRQFLHFVAGVFGVFEKQINTERQLNQEQRLLTLLTQHINEGLALFSNDFKVKIWNRPLQRITGFSPKEAIGQPCEEIIKVPDKADWLRELIASYKDSDQSGFVFDGKIITKSKQSKWISVSGSFLRDETGVIEQAIILVRDISREKALEQRKNEFISIATHELRTPITAIKGYLSLLQANTEQFSEKQQLYLNNAYIATERLVGLAEDLLQVIRLDEDRMKFSLQLVQLTKIVEKVTADFSEKASKKGLEFQLTLPPFDTTIVADPIRLEQVFANLIDNAIKYTSKGSISIAFEHYSEKLTKEDKVTVVIKDTGIGIDSKDLDGVFEKFNRSDRAANLREPGAGLGLYIVKSFIEKQQGKITLKSRPKRGSTFAVTFPIAEVKMRSSMGGAK